MQLTEVGKLLTIIASLDNRKLDESTAMVWKLMLDRELPDATLADAQEVVFEWFSTANPYFEVRHLVDGLRRRMRLTSRDIETDVRVAKRLGMLPDSHDRRVPLPADVARRLAEYRAGVNASIPAVEDGGVSSPLVLDVGRRV